MILFLFYYISVNYGLSFSLKQMLRTFKYYLSVSFHLSTVELHFMRVTCPDCIYKNKFFVFGCNAPEFFFQITADDELFIWDLCTEW